MDHIKSMSTNHEFEGASASLRRSNESPLTAIVDRLRNLLGLSQASVREDIEVALEESAGDVTPHERALLRNVLALHDMRVADGMIPRGMVHIRDFVNYLAQCAEKSRNAPGTDADLSVASIDFGAELGAADILRPVLFVPRSMPALDLLVRMQATRTHMALVIDEYGGTDGLVSIEDIVEMIVGDIEDEHDTSDEPRIVSVGNGAYLIDAKTDLDEVKESLGVDFRLEDTPQEVTTLGGLVAWLAGRVPMRGEIVASPVEGYEFEIVEADPRRLAKIRVRATALKEEAED
jgi:CBS domain containing-hemolysin-like protein